MRDDFAVANEQIGLVQSAVQLLQPTIRNGGKDMVFEVILHSGPHEVILQPPCATGSGDPVHGVCLAQPRSKCSVIVFKRRIIGYMQTIGTSQKTT